MIQESFILQTPRLGLREIEPRDAKAFFALCTHPDVMRYVVDEDPPADEQEARRRIAAYPDYQRHGFGRWACIEKATGRWAGFSGLKVLDDFDGAIDLGYRFLPEFWGQGLATEAGAACVRHGFEVLGLQRIIGLVLPENRASVRVLQKCGMRFDRWVSCPPHDRVALYAVEAGAVPPSVQ